jgi:hypothetical protein
MFDAMKRNPTLMNMIVNVRLICLVIFLFTVFLLRANTKVTAHAMNTPEKTILGIHLSESPSETEASTKHSVAAFIMNDKAMGNAAVLNPMIDTEESDTFELGCEFTLEFPITITELGLYDVSGDGIAGISTVTIWNRSNQTEIIMAEVPAGTDADLINGFRYVNIVDTRLQPGTYIMSVYAEGEGYGMNTGLSAQTGNGISLNAGVYSVNQGYPANYNYSYGFFGANFLYTAEEPAVTEPGESEEATGTWELGCAFTVNAPILVTQLGTFDIGGDGLSAQTPVTIWRVSDQSIIVSCIIPAGDTAYLINNFRYSKVNPVYLEPGQYRMSSYFVDDGYIRNITANSVTVPEITLTGGAFAVSHSYPSNSNSTYYFGANLMFTSPMAAVNNPLITNESGGTWELGYEFEVIEPITLIELGTFDGNDDGLTAQTIVTLWNTADQSIILRDTVPAGTSAPLINGFRYADIPDYTIQPGTYRISSFFTGGEYGWSALSTAVSEITLSRGVYNSIQGYPSEDDANLYYGPNFIIRQSCAAADIAAIDGTSRVCSGESVELSIVTGNINDSENWQWHLGDCAGTKLGVGNSILVNPTSTTSFSVRGEGTCLNNGPCAVHTIEVFNVVTVTHDGNTLISDVGGDGYQWIDCNDGNAPIPGATDQSFTPEQSGNYGVLVTFGDCTVESICHEVTITNLRQNTFNSDIYTYPNPVHDLLLVEIPESYDAVMIELVNLQGQIIFKDAHKSGGNLEIDFSKFDPDLYYLRIYATEFRTAVKIVKE